jgi:addiction module HigA family antidote
MTNAMKKQTASAPNVAAVSDNLGVNNNNLDQYLAMGAIEPMHPGVIFRIRVVEERGLQVAAVARKIGIVREMLYRILRGDSSVTAKTAIGMAEVAGNDAEFWLRSQVIFDLWKERDKKRQALAHPEAVYF